MNSVLNMGAIEVTKHGMTRIEKGYTMEWPRRWALAANEGDRFALVVYPPDYPDLGETEQARFVQGSGSRGPEILGTKSFFKMMEVHEPATWPEMAEVVQAVFGTQFRGLMTLEEFEKEEEPEFSPGGLKSN